MKRKGAAVRGHGDFQDGPFGNAGLLAADGLFQFCCGISPGFPFHKGGELVSHLPASVQIHTAGYGNGPALQHQIFPEQQPLFIDLAEWFGIIEDLNKIHAAIVSKLHLKTASPGKGVTIGIRMGNACQSVFIPDGLKQKFRAAAVNGFPGNILL